MIPTPYPRAQNDVMAGVVELAIQERADFADLLADLTADEWRRPVLPGWSVRDVAAHVISFEPLGWARLWPQLVRTRFSLERANAARLAQTSTMGPAEILQQFRAYPRPVGLTSAFGGRIGLADGLIHHQDVRRALGRPRLVPVERLQVVIPFALWAPPLPGRRLAGGLRLVPTDADAVWGNGIDVFGSAEALLMGIAGRDVHAELSGPGAAILARRRRNAQA